MQLILFTRPCLLLPRLHSPHPPTISDPSSSDLILRPPPTKSIVGLARNVI